MMDVEFLFADRAQRELGCIRDGDAQAEIAQRDAERGRERVRPDQ